MAVEWTPRQLVLPRRMERRHLERRSWVLFNLRLAAGLLTASAAGFALGRFLGHLIVTDAVRF